MITAKDIEKLGNKVAVLAEKVIIVNWFDCDHISSFAGRTVKPKEYAKFLDFLYNESSMADQASNIISELWDEFQNQSK